MSRRGGVGAILVLAVVGMALLFPYLVRTRTESDRVRCKENLRKLATFAAANADPARRQQNLPSAVPAGTIPNLALPPESRLSWVPAALPLFDQRRQPTAELVKLIHPELPWNAPAHETLAGTRLVALLCPANPPAEAAVTQYVGLAGLGADAATLTIDSPRAGCFRYDAPTPLADIAARDGLSQSALFGETSTDLGPWLRGGPSTVRGLSDGVRVIGPGGMLGGNHPTGAHLAFADGSVRFLTERADPLVLRALLTINGGPTEVVGD